MKALALSFLVLPLFAFAQNVNVKDINADTKSDETTLIQIKKGKSSDVDPKTGAIWEVHDGTNDIEGDSFPLQKEAVKSWTEECKTWKKEFRDDNKGNMILNLDCGKKSCTTDGSGTTCTSKASYKIKTKMN